MHFQRRRELVNLNALYKDQKLNRLFDLLNERPLEPLPEIAGRLGQENMTLSLYERIFVLKSQLAYVELQLKAYEDRAKSSETAATKHKKLEETRGRLLETLAKDSATFSMLFKKPIKDYYY